MALTPEQLERVERIKNARQQPPRGPAPNPNGSHPQPVPSEELEIVCATDIIARPVEWLWENHLAIGKLTMLHGESELGKSTVSCDLVGRISAGKCWPDETPAPIGNVIIVSSEDAPEDTIKPRLMAAGADLKRVYFLKSVKKKGARHTFNLAADLELLGKTITTIGDVKLVVFDPVTAYLGHKIDSHQVVQIRAVLEPLQAFADHHRLAGLLIAHPQKNAGTNVLNAVAGSVALINIPRLSFLTIKDPDDPERTLLLPGKNNIGIKAAGRGYRIGRVLVGNNIFASQVIWDELPVKLTANQALSQTAERQRGPAKAEAEDFLREHTTGEGMSAKELFAAAKAHGHSEKTVRRAAEKLNIKPRKNDFHGEWWWKKD